MPDSALIVQAIHATLAGLGADVWFEYVRTDANVADRPSREDMRCSCVGGYRHAAAPVCVCACEVVWLWTAGTADPIPPVR